MVHLSRSSLSPVLLALLLAACSGGDPPPRQRVSHRYQHLWRVKKAV